MLKKRDQWSSRLFFIMAAVGSAIGLGNLWRFSYVAAQNGGGTFLLPYIIALITTGIPLMVIEYGLGVRSQFSAHGALGRIHPAFRFVGWAAILGAFTVCIYYCLIMGWSLYYLFQIGSIEEWGASLKASEHFFFKDFLEASSGPWGFGEFQGEIYLCLALIWLAIGIIIYKGLESVGKVLLFTVPLPAILVAILVARGLTLPGAVDGLNFYLSPSWEALLNPSVWLAAYGQVFFSLSIGSGVMIAYASFMPKNTEIPNSAILTSFLNCGFSFFVGFSIFTIFGYYAFYSHIPIEQIAKSGPGLAFIVFPTALATLPFWQEGFAFLFYAVLLLLGIDSAFSLLEAVVAGFEDAFKISRKRLVIFFSILGAFLGLPLASSAGIYWLDIIDHFLLNYLLVFIGLIECIAVGYFLKDKFLHEINQHAEVRLGRGFLFITRVVAPVILSIVMITALVKEIEHPYEGYPISAILCLGIAPLVMVLALSVLLSWIQPSDSRRFL